MSRWKIGFVTLVCLAGIFFALPNLSTKEALEDFPSWMPKKQVTLGLDLQGGSHLLLEVDLQTVLRDYAGTLVDSIRTVLRKERVGYTGLRLLTVEDDKEEKGPGVTFTLREALTFEKQTTLRKSLLGVDPSLSIDGLDQGRVVIRLSPVAVMERRRSAMQQTIEIIRRRLDETGTKELTIQQQGDDRVLVQIPGIEDPRHVKELLGKSAWLTFQLLDEETDPYEAQAGRLPPSSKLLWGDPRESSDGQTPIPYVVKKAAVVTGGSLIDAQPDIHEGAPVVTFKLDSVGAKKFGDVTQANVGRRFAIILDDVVISAPVINQAIYGGNVLITGRFTMEQASDMALLLRAGALPAPVSVLEERTVGPDLGADSIEAGQRATLIAILLVAVFMIVAYMAVGIVADIALVFNVVFLFAAMSLIGATLTLPGIAGIALTLGMAVDANVLINERIKEELRAGHRIMVAIDAGYNRAMATIIDSNVTTLIGSLLLYVFGTGPVRGFAVTLSVGILISMFTAVTLTRVILVLWVRWRHPKTLWI